MIQLSELRFLIIFLCILLTIATSSITAYSQDTPKINPASINISSYSNEQILAMLKLYNLDGLPEEQLVLKAAEAGFSSDQIEGLKSRLSKDTETKEINIDRKELELKQNKEIEKPQASSIYGLNFFHSKENIFKPDLKIPTPGYYRVGAGDKLNLNLYGDSEVKYELQVSPEGYINIPYLGPLMVGGNSIDEIRKELYKALPSIYPAIKTGRTSFQIFLKDIRTIRITLIGEVNKPALYNLSSLSTIASALHETGGPSNLGSLRSIDLIRNGKVLVNFDFYDFLQRGDLSKNIMLQDGDVIKVNPYQTKVYLGGAIKRSGYYELKSEENLNDAVVFAGGLADQANNDLVTIYRLNNSDKTILNIEKSAIESISLKSSDSVVFNSIIDKFNNRIVIQGSVYYPGDYSLNQTPTLKNLLTKAILRENTLYTRALLVRKRENFTDSLINFNVSNVISGKENIDLIREDNVTIFSIDSLTEKFTVEINGAVNKPGSYNYSKNLRVSDLILFAGGLKEGASVNRIEIGRRIRNENDLNASDNLYAIVKVIDINSDKINTSKNNFNSDILEPFDIVSIRKLPYYKEQLTVSLSGEVHFPGSYIISDRKEKLSDLIDRAGGLKLSADVSGAVLLRQRKPNPAQIKAQENKLNLLDSKIDTVEFNTMTAPALSSEFGPVGIQLDLALRNKGSEYDIFVEPGDSLYIPTPAQTLQAFGAVNNSVKIVYKNGMNLKDAIERSGGFGVNAFKSAVYVVHTNGQSFGTKNFLFFKSYPKIKPGSDIYVPIRSENKLRLADVLGVGTTVSTAIVTLLYLINITSR